MVFGASVWKYTAKKKKLFETHLSVAITSPVRYENSKNIIVKSKKMQPSNSFSENTTSWKLPASKKLAEYCSQQLSPSFFRSSHAISMKPLENFSARNFGNLNRKTSRNRVFLIFSAKTRVFKVLMGYQAFARALIQQMYLSVYKFKSQRLALERLEGNYYKETPRKAGKKLFFSQTKNYCFSAKTLLMEIRRN